VIARVAASRLLVVASPTYKATCTGLLKAFLDRFPHQGLAGVTAVPLMLGASHAHALAPVIPPAPETTQAVPA
jgi:FMN reductase